MVYHGICFHFITWTVCCSQRSHVLPGAFAVSVKFLFFTWSWILLLVNLAHHSDMLPTNTDIKSLQFWQSLLLLFGYMGTEVWTRHGFSMPHQDLMTWALKVPKKETEEKNIIPWWVYSVLSKLPPHRLKIHLTEVWNLCKRPIRLVRYFSEKLSGYVMFEI